MGRAESAALVVCFDRGADRALARSEIPAVVAFNVYCAAVVFADVQIVIVAAVWPGVPVAIDEMLGPAFETVNVMTLDVA